MKAIFIKSIGAAALIAASSLACAITVTDAKGKFTINTTPKRVVALELSYVDALSQIGVSPVGVADDKEKDRILPQVRKKVGNWQSVGMRSQPSLEAISSLKPDLIIADVDRNSAIYGELKKIAPTLILNSRYSTYQGDLQNAQIIADVLGKSAQMKQRISTHRATMQKYAKALAIPRGTKALYGNSREDSFHIATSESYTGGVLAALGFTVPSKSGSGSKPLVEATLEQVARQQPEYLFIAHYRTKSIAHKWSTQALWKTIPAVKKNRVVSVDSDTWARARGIEAAEQIAREVQQSVK